MDFWASSGAWNIVAESTGMTRDEFLDLHDVDLRYIDGPLYIGKPLEKGVDIWGVRRKETVVPTSHGTEVYSEVAGSPLADMSFAVEIEAYDGWPDPDDFDYSVVKKQASVIKDRGRVAVFMGDRLNRVAQLKPAMYLRGVERILLDLAVAPELARVVFGRIVGFYEKYLTRILDAADGFIDIVLTGDDFGQQRGLLVSPAMWDDFLSRGFCRYLGVIRGFGVKSMHHTCGDVRLLAPRMSELGLDILQSLQPEAMEEAFVELKEQLGGDLCFHGGVSIQQTLPSGGVVDIEGEVKRRVKVLAPGGGYILGTAHNVQADTPYENMVALLKAYSAFGRYR